MSFFDKIFLITGNFESKTIILFFLSLFAVIFEVLGIGMIFPAITVITGGEIELFNFNLNSLINSINLTYAYSKETIVLVLLLIFFFFKFCFMLFYTWYQANFIASTATSISQNLFSKYLFSEYSFYFKKDVPGLMRNVLAEANSFIKKVFIPYLQILMDSLILIGILFLIFIVDYQSSSILVIVYGTLGITYFIIFKKKMHYIGKQQLYFDKLRIKSSQEAFFGIKTIKAFLKEKNFITNFYENYKKVADLSKSQNIVQQIPRYATELITITSFVIICLYMMEKSNNFNDIIPTLTLFVSAAFRLIPATNRLMINSQMIRSGLASTDNLAREIDILKNVSEKKADIKKINSFNKIKIQSLSYSYDNKINILENLNLEIKSGEKIGIVGKTGSGKTTLVDLILGLIKPTTGRILIDDMNIQNIDHSWKNILGYVSQETFLLDDTIQNNIVFDNKIDVDKKTLNDAINNAEIIEFLKDGKSLDQNIGERGIVLSGGQKQRIGIARALYKKSKIIIFDESTSSLDLATESKIMDCIYNLTGNITLILISHRESTLSKCDKIFEVKNKNLNQIK